MMSVCFNCGQNGALCCLAQFLEEVLPCDRLHRQKTHCLAKEWLNLIATHQQIGTNQTIIDINL